MADTDLIECSCLEVFGEDPDCPLHGIDALEARLAEKDARIAGLCDLVDRLRLEAQIHTGEARGANATIHEAYQAVTEGKGEPGNWNGAVPIKEELTSLRAQLTASRAECEGLRQRYVDANEALLDMERALIRIADATMPGLARRIAREALPIARAALREGGGE